MAGNLGVPEPVSWENVDWEKVTVKKMAAVFLCDLNRRLLACEAENRHLRTELLKEREEKAILVRENLGRIDQNRSLEKPQQTKSYASAVAKKVPNRNPSSRPSPSIVLSEETAKTEPTLKVVEKMKRQPIKGNYVPKADDEASSLPTAAALTLNSDAKRDFCIRGLPKDVTEKAISDHLDYIGLSYRFVEIKKRADGDRRGTTFARIGCNASNTDEMLDPSRWPPNISVRLWKYYPRAPSNSISDLNEFDGNINCNSLLQS